jgi:MarR family 2-MHQ and catechol resistance regulon transcriptional repressor
MFEENGMKGRKVLITAGARGLVRRAKVIGDRRQLAVHLTPAGRSMIEALFPRHAADIAAAMSGLGTAELVQLGELLRRLGKAAA